MCEPITMDLLYMITEKTELITKQSALFMFPMLQESRFVTRVTRQVPLLEQEFLTLSENLSSLLVFSGVRVAPSLVLCAMFCRSLFVLFSFGHYVVCLSIYGF